MTDTPASLDALGIEPVAWHYLSADEDEAHLMFGRANVNALVPYGTETPLVSADDLAPLLAKARRVEELEAENARLRGMMKPQWFYLGDDQSSDQCRFSPYEVIDEDFFGWGERKKAGQHVVHISTAMPGPDIWAVVSVLTEAEKDARDDDEPWLIEEYGTEAEARVALKENTDATSD